VALLIVVGMLAAGLWLYLHRIDPVRIGAEATRYLQQYVSGEVRIDHASFSWLGGVNLYDVALYEASKNGTAAVDNATREPVLSCRRIELTHDPLALLWGEWRVRSVIAHAPHGLIVRRAHDQRTNLAGLLTPLEAPTLGDHVPTLPTVELRDARFTVVRRVADEERIIDDLRLTVRARSASPGSTLYDIVWQEYGPQPVSGHSQWDLRSGVLRNIDGGLPWMSIESVMFAIDAGYDGAGSWCDLLGLDGRVRARDFVLGSPEAAERSATIVLERASISIPIDRSERSLAPAERYLRFDRAEGTLKVTPDAIHADFRAAFHGSACRVAAVLHSNLADIATLDDVAFDAELAVEGLSLPLSGPEAPPDHARFIQRWQRLQEFYVDYQPAGVVDFEAKVHKPAGPATPVVLEHARLTARNATTVCRFFAYPLTDVTGVIESTADGVFIRAIRGRHDGGDVQIDGWLEAPLLEVPATLTIAGRNIPLDHALYQTLDPPHRSLWDQFTPAGRVNVDVSLTRPRGTRDALPAFAGRVALAFDDLTACYVHFPYPLEHVRGRLTLESGRLVISELQSARGAARLEAEGYADLADEGVRDLQLHLQAYELPLDQTLLDALPPAPARLVQRFHPDGTCDVDTRINFDPGTRNLRHDSTVQLHDVSIRHDALPIPVTAIGGTLHLTPDRVEVSNATGRTDGAALTLEGWSMLTRDAETREHEPPAGSRAVFRGTARNLRLDDALIATLPAAIQEMLPPWQLAGSLDTELALQWDSGREPSPLTVQADARLEGFTLRHPHFPLPFEQVSGHVVLDEQGPSQAGLSGSYGDAVVSLDLEASRDADPAEGTLRVHATNVTLDQTVRSLLPERLRPGWDRLAPQGTIDLELHDLRFRRQSPATPEQPQRLWWVDGAVRLRDVACASLAGSRHLHGTLTCTGRLVDQLGGAVLKGTLDLQQGELHARRIEDLSARWTYLQAAGGDGRFTLDDVVARLYEGYLSAAVELAVTPTRTHYTCTATTRGMQLGPFLNALAATDVRRQALDAGGRADVYLYLTGTLGVPASRRGGGNLEIAAGRFYRLPVMATILHVINLTLPEDDVFDDGRAEFFIVGDRMEIKRVMLWSEALAFAGSGTLNLSDQHLDLHLVSVNPHRGPRVPLLTDFLDGASGELMQLTVVGPLWRPSVSARPLPRLDAEMKSLFRWKKEPLTPTAPTEAPQPADAAPTDKPPRS